MKFKTVIIAHYELIGGSTEYIELDLTTSRNVSATSELTAHPIVDGDYVADHMYRTPTSMTINGIFSMNANSQRNGSYKMTELDNDMIETSLSEFAFTDNRLANIQNKFEDIKDKAVFCDIVMLDADNTSTTRFKTRHDMVLTQINWTENYNSMSFTFTFSEAMTAKVDDIDYNVNVNDGNYPEVTEPSTMSFTENFIDWNEVADQIMKILLDKEVITNEFLAEFALFARTAGDAHLAILGTAYIAALGAAAVYALVSVIVACASNPIGWIVGACLIVVAACAWIIKGIWSWFNKRKKKRKKLKRTFKVVKDQRKMQSELDEFYKFFLEICGNVSILDTYIKCYAFTSNSEQELIVNLDNATYSFLVTKNTADDTAAWNIVVTNLTSNTSQNQLNSNSKMIGLNGIDECDDTINTCLFITENTNQYVYLFNTAKAKLSIEEYSNDVDIAQATKAAMSDVTNFILVVSSIKMTEINKTIEDVVTNYIYG